MTDLYSIITSFPPQPPLPEITSEIDYDQKARAIVSSLRQIQPRDLVGEISGRGLLLDILDPAKQSLSYLFVLSAHYHGCQTSTNQYFPGPTQPGGAIWCKSVMFLQVFDHVQVRYAGHEFNKLTDFVAKASELALRPIAAINPLQQAMLRLDPTCSTFTSTHTTFIRLCLLARCYLPATRILEQDICHFPTTTDTPFLKRSQLLPSQWHPSSITYITVSSGLPGSISYRTYLEYFLYGGMVYVGLKQWEKARHFFHIVISAPAGNSVSMVMVEAYKKWVLVSLLEKGTTSTPTTTISASAAKAFKTLAKPYEVLAIVFSTGTFPRLKAEIQAGAELWRKDHNTGLVFQLLDAFRQFSIIKLQRTFAALALPDIARGLGDTCEQVTEPFAAELLAGNQLNARLFQSSNSLIPSILRFGDPSPAMRGAMESRLWDQLMEHKKRVDVLVRNVCGTDVKLELGKEYIEGLRKAKWRKEGEDHETGALAGNGKDATDFEENIMADL